MNDSKMDWLAYAKTALASDEKAYPADKNGHSFILEWKRSDILPSGLAAFKKIYRILQLRNCLKANSRF